MPHLSIVAPSRVVGAGWQNTDDSRSAPNAFYAGTPLSGSDQNFRLSYLIDAILMAVVATITPPTSSKNLVVGRDLLGCPVVMPTN